MYVAAALSLLVTTSFLNLRRYLRQRHIEMPLPIAGTWVGVGAVLIVIVMMLAMLIPRPGAEVAVSRVPWQAGSPGGMTASRTSVNRDGGEEQTDQDGAQGGEREAKEGQGDLPPTDSKSSNQSKPSDSNKKGNQTREQGRPDSAANDSSKGQPSSQANDGSERRQQNNEKPDGKAGDSGKSNQAGKADQANNTNPSREARRSARPPNNKSDSNTKSAAKPAGSASARQLSRPMEAIHSLTSSVGEMFGVLKILLYIVAAILIGFCVWKYRRQIMDALADIMRQLRELLGGRRGVDEANELEASTSRARLASFSDFRDPFLTGQNGQMSPEELVSLYVRGVRSVGQRSRPATHAGLHAARADSRGGGTADSLV